MRYLLSLVLCSFFAIGVGASAYAQKGMWYGPHCTTKCDPQADLTPAMPSTDDFAALWICGTMNGTVEVNETQAKLPWSTVVDIVHTVGATDVYTNLDRTFELEMGPPAFKGAGRQARLIWDLMEPEIVICQPAL